MTTVQLHQIIYTVNLLNTVPPLLVRSLNDYLFEEQGAALITALMQFK